MNEYIKAIETNYDGYRFRSRLEARWAVFFDVLGVRWEYEPEGFDVTDAIHNYLSITDDGLCNKGKEKEWTNQQLNQKSRINYLPDFYLPSLDKYIEIKPYCGEQFWGNPEHLPIKVLGGYLVHGEPATIAECKYEVCTFDDIPYWFGHCDKCGAFGVGFCAWNSRIHPRDGSPEHSTRCGYSPKEDMTETSLYKKAVSTARSARFDHGEYGQRKTGRNF